MARGRRSAGKGVPAGGPRSPRRKTLESLFLLAVGGPLAVLGLWLSRTGLFLFGGVLAVYAVFSLWELRAGAGEKEP